MADPMPPPGGYDVLIRALREVQERLSTLEAPSGTQRAQLVRSMPVQVAEAASASGFSVPASWTTRASVALVVPEGKTRAVLVAFGDAVGYGDGATPFDYVKSRIQIDGVASREWFPFPMTTTAGTRNESVPQFSRTLTVTEGQTVNVALQMRADVNARPSNANNAADLTVLANFSR